MESFGNFLIYIFVSTVLPTILYHLYLWNLWQWGLLLQDIPLLPQQNQWVQKHLPRHLTKVQMHDFSKYTHTQKKQTVLTVYENIVAEHFKCMCSLLSVIVYHRNNVECYIINILYIYMYMGQSNETLLCFIWLPLIDTCKVVAYIF